jgi:HlyD family secretion protein
VTAGDTLVRLDAALADADVAAAEAVLAGARTRALVTSQDFERARKLGQRAVASAQQLDRARLERDEAQSLLREAEARLSAARKRRADLTLVSPVGGVVDQIPFDIGERVPAGAVLAVIVADGEPWVRVWLPERALAGVRPGSAAEVSVDGIAGTRRGRVLDVSREPAFTPHYALTEGERTHLVYETRVAVEDAPPELRPGVPAQVSFRLGEPNEAAQR